MTITYTMCYQGEAYPLTRTQARKVLRRIASRVVYAESGYRIVLVPLTRDGSDAPHMSATVSVCAHKA